MNLGLFILFFKTFCCTVERILKTGLLNNCVTLSPDFRVIVHSVVKGRATQLHMIENSACFVKFVFSNKY